MPADLLFTLEERKEAWEKNPPKAIPTTFSKKEEKEIKKSKTKIVDLTESREGTQKPSGPSPLDMGMRWDGRKGKWVEDTLIQLTTNTRGNTVMGKTDFQLLAPAALVAKFNEMAESEAGKALGVTPVKRFKDQQTGVKRCEKLEATINGTKEEEQPVAKKAAKKKSITKPKKVEPSGNQTKIAIEFDAREGTNKEKLINALYDSYKKQVPVSQLLKKVYGSMNEENKGALGMVMKGVIVAIKKHKLSYSLIKEKNEKELTFGLHPKR